MQSPLNLTIENWKEALPDHPKFRGEQIFSWLNKGVTFEEMSNLPKSLRDELIANFKEPFPTLAKKQVSKDGTIKYLWRLSDGETIESVAMTYNFGISACLSTQVGCKMNCAFCATAKCGFTRNLDSSEILGQLLAMGRDLGQMPSRVTLMGMGEPLDNWENVHKFLQLAHEPKGLNMSYRSTSISTCGLREGLQKLREAKLPITLSISLHAPDNETRSKLMPANKSLSVEELISFCKTYYDELCRRICIEYVMMDGVSDHEWQARQLAKLLSKLNCYVNLIGYNEVDSLEFKTSSQCSIKKFAEILSSCGVTVTVRRKLGSDIKAACGQLRAAE